MVCATCQTDVCTHIDTMRRFYFHLVVMAKKIALVMVRILAINQTALVQFVLMFTILVIYTMIQAPPPPPLGML